MKRSKREMEIVGKNFAALRISQGLAQNELARRLGIDPSSLCCWETGSRKVDLFTAIDLAKIYNLKIETVVNRLLANL